MASPTYTNADLSKSAPSVFGGLSAIPAGEQGPVNPATTDSSTSSGVDAGYDGTSQPGDPGFNWDHYESYLQTHADPVAAAEQTLAATAPQAEEFAKTDADSQQAPISAPQTVFGRTLTPEIASALAGVHDVGANDALSMALGLGDAVPAAIGKAGNLALNLGGRGAAAYEGYKYGGVPGAIAGAVSPEILGKVAPSVLSKILPAGLASKLGPLAEMLGLNAKAVPVAEEAGAAAADQGGFAPGASSLRNPYGYKVGEIPYQAPAGGATPASVASRPSLAALTPEVNEAPFAAPGTYRFGATTPPVDTQTADILGRSGLAELYGNESYPVVASSTPSGPPSAGGSTGAYPKGNIGEGAFNPTLNTVPESVASRRAAGDVAQGKAISASPAPQPSAPARVLYGPGATDKLGQPAQAHDIMGKGSGSSVLYDPQTSTADLIKDYRMTKAQAGLASDPTEQKKLADQADFLAKSIRQRGNRQSWTTTRMP